MPLRTPIHSSCVMTINLERASSKSRLSAALNVQMAFSTMFNIGEYRRSGLRIWSFWRFRPCPTAERCTGALSKIKAQSDWHKPDKVDRRLVNLGLVIPPFIVIWDTRPLTVLMAKQIVTFIPLPTIHNSYGSLTSTRSSSSACYVKIYTCFVDKNNLSTSNTISHQPLSQISSFSFCSLAIPLFRSIFQLFHYEETCFQPFH